MNVGKIVSAACGNYILMMGAALIGIIFVLRPALSLLGSLLVFLNNVGNG